MLNVNLKSYSPQSPILGLLKPEVWSLKPAFSLVELMIVVAIMGILAAIVLPQYTNQSQKAKEAAAKENLRILRDAIGRYAIHNKDVAPGYPSGNPKSTPNFLVFASQIKNGYLPTLPRNPFNSQLTVRIMQNTATFPTPLGTYGWIFKPATKEIRLDWPGTDSSGVAYQEY
jgi:prepilin-type N-terminal cleavage/methylation domain-containing protein